MAILVEINVGYWCMLITIKSKYKTIRFKKINVKLQGKILIFFTNK